MKNIRHKSFITMNFTDLQKWIWKIQEATVAKFQEINEKYPKITKLGLVLSICLLGYKIRNRWIYYSRVKHKLPPFLPGVPYFGSLFIMAFYGNNAAINLFPKYGPLCSFNIGKQEFIYINDAELIKTVLKHECCRNRPQFISDLYYAANVEPIIMNANDNNKDLWSLRRKLIRKSMIDLFGSNGNNSENNKKKKKTRVTTMDLQCEHLLSKYLFGEIDKWCCQCDNCCNKVIYDKNRKKWITIIEHDFINLKQEWIMRNDMRNASFNLIFGMLFGK